MKINEILRSLTCYDYLDMDSEHESFLIGKTEAEIKKAVLEAVEDKIKEIQERYVSEDVEDEEELAEIKDKNGLHDYALYHLMEVKERLVKLFNTGVER